MNPFKRLKSICKGEVSPEYKNKLLRDLYIYGANAQRIRRFNFFQRIYRRIMLLPTDREIIDPRTIRFSQPEENQEAFKHVFSVPINKDGFSNIKSK